MKIDIEIERNFNYKDFLPSEEDLKNILRQVGEEFIEMFTNNVEQQITWNHDTIDANEVSWEIYKKTEGYDLRSLIMKDKSFIDLKNWTIVIKDNRVTMRMNKDLKFKFYEVQKVGQIMEKNYEEVMPDVDIESELEWFENRFDVLINEYIDKKI